MKKAGSTLVLVLAVISLLLVLSISTLAVSTSAVKTHYAYDNMDKVELAARSGIQLGIAKVNKDNTNLDALNHISFYNNTVTCKVTFTTDADSNIIINSEAYSKSNLYNKKLSYNTNKKLSSGGNEDGNTIGDYFANNCLNVLGDVNSDSINTGTGNGTTITINGSAYLQAKNIFIKSNMIINNGKLSMLTNNDITLDNAGIKAAVNSASMQVQSNNGNINIGSDIALIKSKLYAVANAGSIELQNNSSNTSVDKDSIVYIQSGAQKDIDVYENISAPGDVTMISGKNINTSNNAASMSMIGKVYLKGTAVNLQRTGGITLGDAYIDGNPFNYSGATIKPQNLKINGTLKSNGWEPKFDYTLVSAQQPPAAPASLNALDAVKKFANTKNETAYNTTKYSDLAVRIVKGSDKSNLLNALNNTGIPSNKYKLLIIDGDCTLNYNMNNAVLNNFIIYCTGKLTGDRSLSKITFNNSSIIAKSINMEPSTSFKITQPPASVFTDNFKSEINNVINSVYNGIY